MIVCILWVSVGGLMIEFKLIKFCKNNICRSFCFLFGYNCGGVIVVYLINCFKDIWNKEFICLLMNFFFVFDWYFKYLKFV